MELIAKANQAILEAQWLQREGRSLRIEATILAGKLDETIRRAPAAFLSGTGEADAQTGLSCD
jgi:hypothetical protein